jgi:hypothetical protein
MFRKPEASTGIGGKGISFIFISKGHNYSCDLSTALNYLLSSFKLQGVFSLVSPSFNDQTNSQLLFQFYVLHLLQSSHKRGGNTIGNVEQKQQNILSYLSVS